MPKLSRLLYVVQLLLSELRLPQQSGLGISSFLLFDLGQLHLAELGELLQMGVQIDVLLRPMDLVELLVEVLFRNFVEGILRNGYFLQGTERLGGFCELGERVAVGLLELLSKGGGTILSS